MISQNSIAQVFETARVEEVIGDFVQLKKAGSNFKGLSPFSDERTPVLWCRLLSRFGKILNRKRGKCRDISYGTRTFYYPEAIKYLAKKYNIEIEETERTDEQKEAANTRESMYLVSEYANTYFQNVLHKTDKGKAIGLSYFKERGFTEETIKKFQLGYALDEWQAFWTRL
ncbi:CHC2 zinc finger domain-containing protein [Winogradskyella maritima]|nr:CHC2 zinc finger domain-containing protein [Winogradskyella maritima]